MVRSYYSHPDKPLADHLREVAAGAQERLNHPALCHHELLAQTAYWIGLVHDLGKYTSYFQRYLRTQRRHNGLEQHSFLGAVAVAWLLFEQLEQLPDAPERRFLPLLGYLTVHRHHGNLTAPRGLLPSRGRVERAVGSLQLALRKLEKQLQDLRAHQEEWEPEWSELGLASLVRFVDAPDLRNLFRGLYELEGQLVGLSPESGSRLSLWAQLLYSALIDADKFSAGGTRRVARTSLAPDLVERYLQAKHPQPRHELDRLRNAFRAAVRAQVERLAEDELAGGLFSLTAPTGLGKTLVALESALLFRDRLQSRWGPEHAPRIVYALPFITIIDQNYAVFREVFRQAFGRDGEVPEAALLRHHHLAEVEYRAEEQSDSLPLEQALLMIEAWESEVVVTTFVQLFETILGYRNRSLKKLHNLIGSVIVLDEVQALPMEYWPLTNRVFETLRREMGVVVLQMTATRPLIFPSPVELHPNPSALFDRQRRTRIVVHPQELPLEEWVERVQDLYEEHGSLLVVVNTIGTAREVYRRLAGGWHGGCYGLHPPDAPEWLVHLSTNIVPKQRRQRMEAVLKHLRSGGRALVVSTQVIEAGVDADFPATVRDLGPLDSVVQVAGRCNREGTRELGPVYVLPLETEVGRGPWVYGSLHMNIARRLLLEEGFSAFEERLFAGLVERFFQEVLERRSHETSEELWKAYTRLRFDALELEETALSNFHLIVSPDQVPILVCLDPEDDETLAERFAEEVLQERDPDQRRRAYLRMRRRLHDQMIRPRLRRAAENLPPALGSEQGIRWIPHNQLSDYYSLETGFRSWSEDSSGAWIG